MAIQVDTFVDTHCHMFTVADIPLYTTLDKNIKHPLVLLFGGLVAGLGFKKFKEFIKFFDSEPLGNVKQVVDGLESALRAGALDDFKIKAREKVLTPLVMDFDINGEVEKFEGQLKRLIDAAVAYGVAHPNKKVKVLPFVGLDPRKLVFMNKALLPTTQIKAEVADYLSDHHVVSTNKRRTRVNLKTGDVVGIKLYPPLGFHVYPQDVAERKAYLAVYEQLADLDVPITVHCQKGSYNLSGSDLLTFTTPVNWQKVLGTNASLAKLRINLGHFGGEGAVSGAVNWSGEDDDDLMHGQPFATGPSHVGWASEIIKMLKRYEHAYADISAFNYKDEKAAASLLWLLAYDLDGRLDEAGAPNYPLASKLMWGSDYPMILDGEYKNYRSYFSGFVNAVINRDKVRQNNNYQIPDEAKLPDSSALLDGLVEKNPVKFLFG